MGLILQMDPGGEKFFPFAKKKLRQMHETMETTGVAALSKVIDATDGTRIFLNSLMAGDGVFIDKVRITGGEYIFAKFPCYGTVSYSAPFAPGSSVWITVGDSRIFAADGFRSNLSCVVSDPLSIVPFFPSFGPRFINFGILGVYATTAPIPADPGFIAGTQGGSQTKVDQIVSGAMPAEWVEYLNLIAPPSLPSLPSSQAVVSLVLYGPVIAGVNAGMFGNPEGQTQTQVFGKAVFKYSGSASKPPGGTFTFVSWKPAKTNIINTVQPLAPDLVGVADSNALILWPGLSILGTPTTADKAYRDAILAAL